MLFNYRDGRNLNLVVNAAQISHVVFILLAIALIFRVVTNTNRFNNINVHGLVTIVVGIGCLINAEAVVAILSLNKR